MDSQFFNAHDGGDPVLLQHILWFFGHPESWFTVAIWCLFLAGVLRLAKLLRRDRKFGALAVVLTAFALFMASYALLAMDAFESFSEGVSAGATFRGLRIMKWIVVGLAGVSSVWIIRDFVRSRKA